MLTTNSVQCSATRAKTMVLRGIRATLRSRIFLAMVLSVSVTGAIAHPGGLDKNGCHTERKTGTRHCHREQSDSERLLTCELESPPKAGDLGVFYGTVLRIIDGDTFEARVQGVVMRFRLAEVDAPESDQPYGDKSTNELKSLLDDRDVVLVPADTDRYGRTVAFVWVADSCVNKKMVSRGAAWFYDEYAYSDALFGAEEQARASRVGLWLLPLEQRIPPQEWRQEKR